MNASTVWDINDSSSLRWEVPYPLQRLSSVVEAPRAIRLRGAFPPWADSVVSRLSQLEAIPAVDPRGSRPMNADDVFDALDFMVRVMREDTVVPWIGRLTSGGVQLAWNVGDVEVEAVFDRAREDAEIIVAVGENEWDEPIANAETLFATVVDRLSTSHLEPASA